MIIYYIGLFMIGYGLMGAIIESEDFTNIWILVLGIVLALLGK